MYHKDLFSHPYCTHCNQQDKTDQLHLMKCTAVQYFIFYTWKPNVLGGKRSNGWHAVNIAPIWIIHANNQSSHNVYRSSCKVSIVSAQPWPGLQCVNKFHQTFPIPIFAHIRLVRVELFHAVGHDEVNSHVSLTAFHTRLKTTLSEQLKPINALHLPFYRSLVSKWHPPRFHIPTPTPATCKCSISLKNRKPFP